MAVSHLLQPKGTLRLCRLWFPGTLSRQCVSVCSQGGIDKTTQLSVDVGAEETQIMVDEPLKEEPSNSQMVTNVKIERTKPDISSEALVKKESVTYSGSNQAKRLTDIFHKQSEEVNCETKLSDVLLSYSKFMNPMSKNMMSGFTKLLYGEQKNSPEDGELEKEFPTVESETISPEHQSQIHKELELSSSSSSSNNESDFKELSGESILEHAEEDIVKPKTVMSSFQYVEREDKSGGPATNNHLDTDSPERQCQMHKESESSSSSRSSNSESDFEELSRESNLEPAEEDIVKPKTIMSSFQSLEHEDKSCGPDTNNHSDLKSLLNCLRMRENVQSETADDLSKHREDTSIADSERSSLDIDDELDFLIEEQGTISECSSDLKSSVQAPVCSKNRKQVEEIVPVSKESKKNKLTVWFLGSASKSNNIEEAFERWGKVSKIEFKNCTGPLFKVAHVYFKGKGVENAPQGFKYISESQVVILKSDTSLPHVIPPRLLGDPLAPSALIKHPTRTVKVQIPSPEITTRHLKEAFAFGESKVSGCFFGSTHSTAYVEFETEHGKEKALAETSINIMGNNLKVLRIDSPRTTVVRIMNTKSIIPQTIKLCKSLGEVRSSILRRFGFYDVNFELDEWPNMLNILNRLNGFELEGTILKAEPAPCFPPDVLLALWRDQEGRQHLEDTIRSLLHKVVKVSETCELASTQHEFLRRAFSSIN